MPAPQRDWLQIASDAYAASTSYFDASIRPEIESAIRQFQGVHPSGSKYLSDAYRSRSRLFRPKTRAVIRKNEAVAAEALFSTLDVVSITPADDTNKAMQASAVAMQSLMQYRLTKSVPWFLMSIAAYQESQVSGVVISKQMWEYDADRKLDRPVIKMVPPENFRFDAAAEWSDPIGSSPYLIELLPMYIGDIKARMRVTENALQSKWRPLSDPQIKAAMRPYGDSTRILREGQRQDSREQQNAYSDFNIAWVHQNIVRVDGVDYIYHTLGTTELLDEPRPLKESVWHGERPYVLGLSVIEAFKNYPAGVARITKDTQAEINEVANQRIDNVKFALNKRYFVRRDKRVDVRSLVRNVPSSVTFMDDPNPSTGDVHVVETPDVTSSGYAEQDRLNLDFDDISGAFSSSSVQSNRRLNETVGGMNILTSNANQVSGYQLRTFVVTWVEPVLRQVMKLIQHYETDLVVLAAAGQGAKLVQKFGVDEITDELLSQDLTLNVNVGMGATNPHDQVSNFLQAMEAIKNLLADGILTQYGLDVHEAIKEIFGKLGYRDGSRFFPEGQDDPRIAQMQSQVQQLEAQLQQKQDPQLTQAQIAKISAEIEKTRIDILKTVSDAAFSATQAAEKMAAVPETAPIVDQIMQSGGFQDLQGQDPGWIGPSEAVVAPAPQGNDMPGDAQDNKQTEPA